MQCHVEDHFSGPNRNLVIPWAKGPTAEDQLAYFDESGFADWTHAETGSPMLEPQQPELEIWAQGLHAVVDLIHDIVAAREAGATDEQL